MSVKRVQKSAFNTGDNFVVDTLGDIPNIPEEEREGIIIVDGVGGGVFNYNATMTQNNHNNVTIFSGSATQEATDEGCWIRIAALGLGTLEWAGSNDTSVNNLLEEYGVNGMQVRISEGTLKGVFRFDSALVGDHDGTNNFNGWVRTQDHHFTDTIQMQGNKITGLLNATANSDAVAYAQLIAGIVDKAVFYVQDSTPTNAPENALWLDSSQDSLPLYVYTDEAGTLTWKLVAVGSLASTTRYWAFNGDGGNTYPISGATSTRAENYIVTVDGSVLTAETDYDVNMGTQELVFTNTYSSDKEISVLGIGEVVSINEDYIQYVANVSELQALTGMGDGQLIFVGGRESATDGMGFFVTVINGSQADDGRVYFELADGKRAKFTGAFIREDGVSGDNITANPEVNNIVTDISAATISGGGNVYNQNFIGWDQPYEEYAGDGSNVEFVFPYEVDSSSDLKVQFVRADGVVINVTNFTLVGEGTASATITYPESGTNTYTGGTELTADEGLRIHGKKVPLVGSGADYSTIYGGYDNIVNRLMSQCSGAHQRIVGGDHNSIFGGSYHRISAGSYGIILGGSSSKIHGTSNTGSSVIGGIYGDVDGVCSGIFTTLSGKIVGHYSTILGGANVEVVGNGATAAGRNITINGAGSAAFGESLDIGSQYSTGFGLNNSIAGGGFSFVQGRDNTVVGSYNFVAATQDAQIYHSYCSAISGKAGKSRASGQTIHSVSDSVRPGRKQVTRTLFEASTTDTTAVSGELIDGQTTVVLEAHKTFMYRLTVTARGSNAEGAVFTEHGAFRTDNGSQYLIGTPVTESFVDTGMGDIAASLDLSGTNVAKVTFSPRTTGTVPTEWFAELELHEVGS